MSFEEVIEETERYRVKIVLDEYPENPRQEFDHIAVLTQLNDRYRQPDRNHDPRIVAAWEHGRGAWKPNGVFCGTYHDTEKVERYARAFLGAVAVEWWDDAYGGSRVFGYITAEAVEEAGITDPAAALKVEMDEYTAYAEGDVYGYVIEKRVRRVVTEDGEIIEDDDDAWTEEDSCWGYYGQEWAEQAAREALSYHTDETEENAR